MDFSEREHFSRKIRGWAAAIACPHCGEPLQVTRTPRVACGYERLLVRVSSPCGMFEADVRVSLDQVQLADQKSTALRAA